MAEKLPAPVNDALAGARKRLAAIGGSALLVGVERYPAFGGERDLLAGRNDVLAYWKVCRRLGYRPGQIRVYTSPRLTRDEIVAAERALVPELHPKESEAETAARVDRWLTGPEPLVLDEATAAKITEGVAWLAKALVFTVKLRWEERTYDRELAALPGLLAYSGHGARVEGDLALCPSDVRWSDETKVLENALPFSRLRDLLDTGDDLPGGHAPTDNLTVVLDCCFAGAGQQGSSQRISSLTPGGEGGAITVKKEIGSRVFCASGRDEQAYQAMLGGHWHGAFTWAFTRALEQWKTVPSGQFKKSTVSHAELLFRARMLLEALSFPQHPMLVDAIGNLPVFHHDADAQRETSVEPTAERLKVQIDPSVTIANGQGYAYYRLLSGSTLLVEVIATNRTTGRGMDASTEYWRIWSDTFDTSELSGTLTWTRQEIAWTADPPFARGQASFSCEGDATWGSSAPTDNPMYAQSTGGGFAAKLGYDASKRQWEGTLRWYSTQAASTPYVLQVPTSGSLTLSIGSSPQNAEYYEAPSLTTIGPPAIPMQPAKLYTFKLDARSTVLVASPDGSSYARWTESGSGTQHGLYVTDDATTLVPGHEVYLSYDGSHFISAPKAFNLFYTTNERGDEKHFVRRVDEGYGPICLGERVRFENDRQTRENNNVAVYLSAESDHYLGTRTPTDTDSRNFGTIWILS